MPSSSKRKGNQFEREIVNKAISRGFHAKRAYASDGRSLGMTEDVDCIVGPYRVQAKRRASIANYITPSETVDVQAIREDRGDLLFVIKEDMFWRMLAMEEAVKELEDELEQYKKED